MVDNFHALSGPQTALFWVGLASVIIGFASVLIEAVVKAPVRIGQSLAFRTAFVMIFTRIVFRLLHGGQLTYYSVIFYALPGLACLWATVDAVRYRKGLT